MATSAAAVLEQAMSLPARDRTALISDLLASLDSETVDAAEVDAMWSDETARRAAELASGAVETLAWSHVTSRIDDLRSRR